MLLIRHAGPDPASRGLKRLDSGLRRNDDLLWGWGVVSTKDQK
jgi:hypothetical protein